MLLKRFAYADESAGVLTEATVLGYADSLLRFSYSFIQDFLRKKDDSAVLPFLIPNLRFVQGCIAYSAGTGRAKQGTASYSAAYLLEELIAKESTFIKYIHNADAIPLPTKDEPGHEFAVFLCFVQHIQFVQSHGQVYISDFQGDYSCTS